MDIYTVNSAVEEVKKALDSDILAYDFRDNLNTLIRAAEEYVELKEGKDDVDMVKDTAGDLREAVESAQGTLSDLDDKMGEIYSHLDDLDCAIEGLED